MPNTNNSDIGVLLDTDVTNYDGENVKQDDISPACPFTMSDFESDKHENHVYTHTMMTNRIHHHHHHFLQQDNMLLLTIMTWTEFLSYTFYLHFT